MQPSQPHFAAIDPGASAGFCYDGDGALVLRHIEKPIELRRAVEDAAAAARAAGAPLIFVAENWRPQGFTAKARKGRAHGMGAPTILGMGAAWGAWRQEIDCIETWRVGRRVYPRHTRVFENEWKTAVVGRGRPPDYEIIACARVLLAAHRARGRKVDGELRTLDVAVAVCLYHWARKRPKAVAELL